MRRLLMVVVKRELALRHITPTLFGRLRIGLKVGNECITIN